MLRRSGCGSCQVADNAEKLDRSKACSFPLKCVAHSGFVGGFGNFGIGQALSAVICNPFNPAINSGL